MEIRSIVYEVLGSLHRRLIVFCRFKPEVESALIAKSLQGKSWERSALLSGLQTSTIKSVLRETVKEMFKRYGEKKAFKLL